MSILSSFSRNVICPVVFFGIFGLAVTLVTSLIKSAFQGSGAFSVSFSSDPNRSIIARFGETLLRSLSRCYITVPSPCGGKGSCHQCRVRVVEGVSPPNELEKGVFSEEELNDGWRLACQVLVKNEVKVDLPGKALSLESFSGVVRSNRNVSTFIKELIVELDEPIKYEAGEYLQFLIPNYETFTASWKESIDPEFHSEWEKYGMFDVAIVYEDEKECVRAYSLASYPGEGKIVRFTVRIASPPLKNGVINDSIPWGIGSSYIFSRKEGDRLYFSGPFGESKMIQDQRPLYFLIGGAGASFGRSHIMSLFLLHGTKRKVALWYGARSLKENIYAEEFLEVQKKFPNFTYHLVLSDPTDEERKLNWPLSDPERTGFLFQAFETGVMQYLKDHDQSLYYVCGPPLHNFAVKNLLREYGVPKSSVILDDFGV
ncbi:NADH:ubiquinone reductase (Na(+)-transporting) subunit F [Candidatus Similichlamydia epinepheli]|uniref:NADH:ubiquinone reductase (Na(+)-transporting) subunit F n=1 Tax=Candidatus Similichlamydia epinepheli TaxID=1903953 RepID=UPI0013001B13|nr:NADH:ubiquinone reductase (Na(+)-transporting) subunit F [Candidatus Similichlamydia epinepheli]